MGGYEGGKKLEKKRLGWQRGCAVGGVHNEVCILFPCSTIVVEPDCVASITKYGDIRIQIGNEGPHKIGTELDTIQLSIFSHRFMSTAEQMGR